MAVMLQEREQKNTIKSDCIYSEFSSNTAAVYLSHKSQGINSKPSISEENTDAPWKMQGADV